MQPPLLHLEDGSGTPSPPPHPTPHAHTPTQPTTFWTLAADTGAFVRETNLGRGAALMGAGLLAYTFYVAFQRYWAKYTSPSAQRSRQVGRAGTPKHTHDLMLFSCWREFGVVGARRLWAAQAGLVVFGLGAWVVRTGHS